MKYRRRAGTREVVLIGIALVLVALAVLAYRCGGPEDAAPADEFISFYCPACDHHFQISHRDFERLWDRGEFRTGEGREPVMLFRCPECGEFTARRAEPGKEAAGGAGT